MPQDTVKIQHLVSNEQCYEMVRKLRWPDGTKCPGCESSHVIKRGHDNTEIARQEYGCKDCGKRFDDLTESVFMGHHQPLKVWILCLYFMGLNLSNKQISQELDLNKDDIHQMTTQLREGVEGKKRKVKLTGEVECDEMYVTAGHKGNPDAVRKKGRKGRCRRLKGARGRGTLEKEKPPIFGMIQRSGEVVIEMLANVKRATIAPLVQSIVIHGTTVFTDEYDIYNHVSMWGYQHKTVNHSQGEFARDEDGDGFHEVHINTMEGFWSLLRSWLRPHRGISQEKLPIYLSFFQFIHNAKVRGKRLLHSLIDVLLK